MNDTEFRHNGLTVAAGSLSINATQIKDERDRLREALRQIVELASQPGYDMRDWDMASIAARALEGTK
jgi:hypothetical protein